MFLCLRRPFVFAAILACVLILVSCGGEIEESSNTQPSPTSEADLGPHIDGAQPNTESDVANPVDAGDSRADVSTPSLDTSTPPGEDSGEGLPDANIPWPEVTPGMYDDVDPLGSVGPIQHLLSDSLNATTAHPVWLPHRGLLSLSISRARNDDAPSYRPYLLEPPERLIPVVPDLFEQLGETERDRLGEQFAWCNLMEPQGENLCWVRPRKADEQFVKLEGELPNPTATPVLRNITSSEGSEKHMSWVMDAVNLSDGTAFYAAFKIQHGTEYGGLLRYSPTPEPSLTHALVATEAMTEPIALALSADESTLYFTTRGPGEAQGGLWTVAINEDGTLGTPGQLLTDLAAPDGLAIDAAYNIYIAANEKILVYGSDGALRGELPIIEEAEKNRRITGLAFGGQDAKTLYITYGIATRNGFIPKSRHEGALYAVTMPIPGLWTLR